MFSPVTVIVVVLLAIVSLLVSWIVSEFRWGRRVRLILGCATIVSSFGVAFVIGTLEQLNYNAWYGHASKQLVDSAISQLEAGHTEKVLSSLRRLQKDYEPTYENRARYDELVGDAVAEMSAK